MCAYTKTIADADEYYYPNNHIKSYSWRAYEPDEQEAALAHAKRMLEVSLGRDLEDPASTDVYRDDYAVFEQALYILDNVPRQKSNGIDGVVDLVEDNKEGEALKRKPILICPEAKQFLAHNIIRFARG